MKKADNFDAKQWLVENKITFQSRLNEGADKYPYQASPEKIALYDKIANELEKTISMIANKLGTSESNIRISLDNLWDDLKDNKAKKKGMFIQVKTDDTQWKEAWTGNALIMQTQNGEGIVIPSNPFFGIKVEGQKNPKVRSLFNKALDLDLEDLAASENARIADSLSPEEVELIAPNTPVIVTGTQSRLNEGMAEEKMYEVTITHKITKRPSHVWITATSEEEARKNVENSGMKLENYYISSVVELYHSDDENKIEGVDVEYEGDYIELSGDSGDYGGNIEDDGTVSFTVTNDEEDFNDQNWKDILGDDHVFVKIANAIPTKVEALGDYVMITVKADDLIN